MRWLLAIGLLILVACRPATERNNRSGIELLTSPAGEGFVGADRPRRFVFPDDHGVHPGFRSEWWYVTGHLFSGKRQFGYQLTFFRFVVDPAEDAEQAWESDAVWLAQVALSDLENGEFYTSEQFTRELSGISQAALQRLDVQVQGWRLYQAAADPADGARPYQLRVVADEFELELDLLPDKPLVLQGDQGWSKKSANDPMNASYYYSQTRLTTNGKLKLNEEQFEVRGSSWFDREWSTSALHARQTGWDWFALQLDNQHELMFYRLRLEDGSIDTASAGVWVDAEGRTTRLGVDDVQLEPTRFWRSSDTDSRYPIAWEVSIDSMDLQLQIEAIIPNQLWNSRLTYWEGAMKVTGKLDNQPIGGLGYVELTGY